MATRVFNQTDDVTPTCVLAAGCSGRAVGAGTNQDFECIVGGALGISSQAVSVPASATDVVCIAFCCVPASAFIIAPGIVEVKLDFDSIGGNIPLIDEVHVCRFNSGCTNVSTIGSLTGIGASISTGVQTRNVPCVATQINASDVIMVLVVLTNASSMSAATCTIVPDQTITFTEGTAADLGLGGSSAAMWVLGLLK